MMDDKCCGTCKHHFKHVWNGPGDLHKDDWWCACEDSDAYGAYTDYDDGFLCEEYEQREPKKLSERLSSELDRRTRAFQNYGR